MVLDCMKFQESYHGRWIGSNGQQVHIKKKVEREEIDSIDCLVDAAGRSHNTEEGMARTVKDFFGSVFQSSSPSEQDIERATAGIKTRVCDDSSMGLSSAFTADDVRTALFSMSPTKALGPVGFRQSFSRNAGVPLGGRSPGSIMVKMNLHSNLISLILDCISSSSLTVLLNGRAACSVALSRGLRQGCPISPYLFLLCAEAFSCLISSSEENGRVLGLRCVRGSPLVSHLFFADDSILFCRANLDGGLQIRKILDIYERGSGQQVNLQKSQITFSPNVDDLIRNEIKCLFEVNACNTHDRYLCLPSMVGRNKRVLFNDIKERVWKKMRGWKDIYFSFGEKEVLIKAVAQAIPSYSMSIFRLPVGLCNDLKAMVSKFWWGSRDGKRKISWIKLEDLCLPKNCGGLGFKDLSLFNQALLAKQAWRIVSDPSSLASRVIQAKYFKQTDFLNAPIKAGCSHIWRSLVWGRSLLAKGLRWAVGDKNSIRVFKDCWLPRPCSFKPITFDHGIDIRVADLMNRPRTGWDMEKLNRILLPTDKEVILSILVSWSGGQDSLRWHYEKKRVFTVKSGYCLALNDPIQGSVSNLSKSHHWWNLLWSLVLPPKVKIFIWRACLNAVPSLENLYHRKIVAAPSCTRCASHVESTSHALFGCKAARRVWAASHCSGFLALVRRLPVMDALKFLASHLSLDDFGLTCMVTWAIWEDRNALLNCGTTKELEMVIAKATTLVDEFKGSKGALCPQVSPTAVNGPQDWVPPPPGLLKLNVGAAVRRNAGCIGIGVVIRDDKGEGDVRFIVNDIRVLLSDIGPCKCQAAPSSGNVLAQKLAAIAFSSVREHLWLDPNPFSFPAL
ncbi:hypothetical protein Dsin_025409 [Dipteronia sinensis]|uniref:Reverse transcriptase domain-containing protein n=1 Tax=Dipteronia sinensis TaxID=43782 RepID=A0AAD9ZWW3_9ROSI|nr:hypothetical protein Dsin_025409 [Dipteronia sinensis]